jgi:hypothetical protein
MNGLFLAAQEAQRFFRRKRWRFCIIGGLAVIRWGEPRATQDVDISLLTPFGKEEKVIDTLLGQFDGRIPDVRPFALESRVLLCKASNGVPLDITLAAFSYEEQVIARASKFTFAPRVSLTIASAEDLIVLKAFADRDSDWVDVRGIIERQGNRLEWDYISHELTALCDLRGDAGPLERLARLQEAAGSDQGETM